jgi:O-antigen/teichoic acid export membrane protein
MLCEPHTPDFGAFIASLALPLAAALAISLAIVLAIGRLGRRQPDAFALSLAAFIGLFLYPAVVIVPAWLAGASDRDVGGFLAHTNVRGVLLLTIFGALGSWLASPALITLCAATHWTRGAARPPLPLVIIAVGVLANWWWVNWWSNAC